MILKVTNDIIYHSIIKKPFKRALYYDNIIVLLTQIFKPYIIHFHYLPILLNAKCLKAFISSISLIKLSRSRSS